MKVIFPHLSKQIDDHRIVLSCPLCGFGTSLKNKTVVCTRCKAFISERSTVEAISKWNERCENVTKRYGILYCPCCNSAPDIFGNKIRCEECTFTLAANMGFGMTWDSLRKMWNKRYKSKTMEV